MRCAFIENVTICEPVDAAFVNHISNAIRYSSRDESNNPFFLKHLRRVLFLRSVVLNKVLSPIASYRT